MLRGKPFHHFRGKLHYHFLRGKGVNKIFVLFPQVVDIARLFGHKKRPRRKNLQGLFLYSVLPFFLYQALPRIIVSNLAKILYHNHLGEIKTCSAILAAFAQMKTSFYATPSHIDYILNQRFLQGELDSSPNIKHCI